MHGIMVQTGETMNNMEIKEWRHAVYLLPLREIDGKKQIAFLVYKNGWHTMIGGRQDEGEAPRQAICREVCEELGDDAKCIAECAIEISEKYRRQVHDVERRGARNEEHTFFVAKVPADIEFNINQEDLCGCEIMWVDIDELKNSTVAEFRDTRENVRAMIKFIEKL